MDNKEQIMTNIRLNLKKLLRFTSNFNNFILSDGTQVTTSSSDIEEGAEVYQVDDQGNQTPLDNGDYVLQDGRTFTVQDNKVTVIALPEEDGTDVETGDVETDDVEMGADGLPAGHDGKPQDSKDKPEIDEQADGDMSSRLEALEAQVAELMNIINQLAPATNEANEQIMSTVQKMESAMGKYGYKPAEKSIKSNKKPEFQSYNAVDKKTIESNDAVDRLRAIRKDISARKNINRII